MTISSATNKVQISSGTNITITDLEAQNTGQVLVTKTDSSDVETVLVITTDYTINSAITAVTLNDALGAGETATSSLSVPNTQATDYKNNSPFNAETAEDAFDKLTLKNKQQQEELDRGVKFVISETASSNIEIPDITGNTDKYLKLNSAGTAFEWATLSTTAGLGNIVEDTSPQLGGDLLSNSFDLIIEEDDLIIFEGATDDAFETTLTTVDPTADRTVSLPNASDTLTGKATTDTLTNKTINADGTGNVITNIGSSEIKSEIISGQSEVVIAAGDSILLGDVGDTGNLKRDTVQGILDLAVSAASQAEQEAATSTTVYT